MITETEVEQVERKAYIAWDGQKFYSQTQCELYERKLERERIWEIVKRLPHFGLCPPDWRQEGRCTWYYVRNFEELTAVRHIEVSSLDSTAYDFEPEAYPCWIQVIYEENDDSTYIEELDDVIFDHMSFLAVLKRCTQECAPKEGDKDIQQERPMKYTVTIEETVCKEFEVTATSESEARIIAERKYLAGEFVLDDCTVTDKQMRACANPEDDTDWHQF